MSRPDEFTVTREKRPSAPLGVATRFALMGVSFLLMPAILVGATFLREARSRTAPPPLPQRPSDPPVATPPAAKPALVADVLLKPYRFRFAEETPLSEVAKRLSRDLGVRVVLDLAALRRMELKDSSTVKLELEDVRLKTGLKLLLDQVDLTYKVVAEDNLLVITDAKGAEDPIEKLTREVKAMHEEIHDIQDLLDELFVVIDGPAEGMPEPRNEEPKVEPPAETKPKEKAKQPPRRDGAGRSRPGF